MATLGILAAYLGCTTQVARDLEASSANEMVLVLQQAGTPSTKEPDPDHDGRWMLSVPKAEATRATEALAIAGVPGPPRPGLIDVSMQSSLVPSLQTEQARLLSGVSNDLERTLTSIDGMVSARVHLALANWDPLSPAAKTDVSPSASVLLRFRGSVCPISIQDVQRLVAGAVSSEPNKVQVVSSVVPAAHASSPRVVAFGPLAISAESARMFRIVVGISIALNLTTLGVLIFYWRKARRRPAD